MKTRPDPALLAAGLALFRPKFPDLDAGRLVAALRAAAEPAPKPEAGKALSPAEVARRLGVCRKTVHRMIARGTLPAVHLSRRAIRVPEAALAALVEGRGGE